MLFYHHKEVRNDPNDYYLSHNSYHTYGGRSCSLAVYEEEVQMKYKIELELVVERSPNYNIPELTPEDVKLFVETALRQDNRIFRITATNVVVKEMNSSTLVANYVKAMEELE